jgi:hypothetical protein
MTIYYHGTDNQSADKIKKDGIEPTKSKYSGGIYLTTNYGEAQKYSKIASNGKTGKVLKIHKDNLNKEHTKDHGSGIIQYNGKINPEHIKEDVGDHIILSKRIAPTIIYNGPGVSPMRGPSPDVFKLKEDITVPPINVSGIAGTGDSRLPADQREPAINKKKPLRAIVKRKKRNVKF